MGNRGRGSFGGFVRPPCTPNDLVALLGEVGAWGVNLHDNDLVPNDQDLRFGSVSLKAAFWLVKFLEDVGYQGPCHFDAHAYRAEDYEGVRDFARGCMRTYLMFKEKAARWNADGEIQAIINEICAANGHLPCTKRYSKQAATALLGHSFDKNALLKKRLPYERLDQLTVDILLGTR